jgi:thiol:disulfide interchange protein DsbD
MKLKFYANKAEFKQKVKVLASGTNTLTGSLEFMCCDDTKCLPPSDVDFSFDLEGSGNAVAAAPQSKILEPVKWKFTAEKTGPKKYDLFFKAHIDKGYHLYSLTIPENGPLPTEFSFETSENYKLIGKPVEVTKPIEQYDDVFEMNIKFFEDEAVFKQSIELTSNNNDIPVIGEIAYMTCNETGCVALYNDIEFHFDGKNDRVIAGSQEEPQNED